MIDLVQQTIIYFRIHRTVGKLALPEDHVIGIPIDRGGLALFLSAGSNGLDNGDIL